MNYGHRSEHFRAVDDVRQLARPAEETEPTQALVKELLAHLKNQFYTTARARAWFQEEKKLLMVLTWPASWLNQRGVGLPLARYEAILREIILGIQQHGATDKIQYFPAYFERTVKAWFIHNGEALYEERKSIRNYVDLRFLKGLTPTVPKGPDPMEILAQAHRVLATTKHRPKAPKSTTDQLTLL